MGPYMGLGKCDKRKEIWKRPFGKSLAGIQRAKMDMVATGYSRLLRALAFSFMNPCSSSASSLVQLEE